MEPLHDRLLAVTATARLQAWPFSILPSHGAVFQLEVLPPLSCGLAATELIPILYLKK